MKSQNLGPWVMKSSQSNFDLQSQSSYLARSYLIATVHGTTLKIHQENEDLRLESDSKVPTSVLSDEEIDLDLLDLIPEGSFFLFWQNIFFYLMWQFFE